MKIEYDPENKTVRISLPDRSREQIIDAIVKFDAEFRETQDWQNWTEKENHKYAIQHNEKLYPVKKIISLATGVHVSEFSGGNQSNDYIKKHGFKIIRIDGKPPNDHWQKIIQQIRQDHIPPERISIRKTAENEARKLLESQLGNIGDDNLRQFFSLINTDYFNGKNKKDRFSPAFVGAYTNRIMEQTGLFNEWAEKFQKFPDSEIANLLDEFWSKKPISYAGMRIPGHSGHRFRAKAATHSG